MQVPMPIEHPFPLSTHSMLEPIKGIRKSMDAKKINKKNDYEVGADIIQSRPLCSICVMATWFSQTVRIVGRWPS